MSIRFQVIQDEHQLDPSKVDGARALCLHDCLERRLLISPDTGEELFLSVDGSSLTDGNNSYEIKHNCPLLYPGGIREILLDASYPEPLTPLQQYVLLGKIKQSGEINAPFDSIPARKHQYRLHRFCEQLNGLVLDIGSDRPSHSMLFLPHNCEYLGLDPFAANGEFRIIGLGEILPLQAASVDSVLFNTSLDHILDYHTAIDEAFRVLKPGGTLVIATYAWLERATLLTDSVHFHHFRESEIFGALQTFFAVKKVCRYEDPKHDSHRYGLYVMATKVF